MAASLMVSGSVALLGIAWKIVNATVYRSEIISRGYSGEIDVGDIVAFALGYCFIVVNHIRLRRRVLRA